MAAGESDGDADAAARPAPSRRLLGLVPGEPLLGRDSELAGVARLLDVERLVTVVGPGGVGKTRLALELSRRTTPPTEVTVLALAPVTDPDALPDAGRRPRARGRPRRSSSAARTGSSGAATSWSSTTASTSSPRSAGW